MTETNKIRKTNVTLNRKDIRDFKRLILDWEDEYDFPIELKESHCLNAAVKLIIRASSPELIDEFADQKQIDESSRKQLQELYKWFLDQYLDVLKGVISDRVESDKRRVQRV
ncbi:hypothetical protein [Nocardia paucivorans]|uniref:hypothetical protein n=1 Tax=Nocardia paucivorans TaxID=114259 RepID=UPI0012FC528D|nr:hypothetical protein [Nocardia paucivorans]